MKHAGARFQRISQELEASAAAAQGAAVWRLQPLFQPPDAPPEQLAAAQQVGFCGYGWAQDSPRTLRGSLIVLCQ